MKWNKSALFALAVGTLSDKLREYSFELQKNNISTNKNSSLLKVNNKIASPKTLNNSKGIIVRNNIKSKESLNINKKHFKSNNNEDAIQDWLFEEKRRISDGEAIK